jgi:hypothetical protein
MSVKVNETRTVATRHGEKRRGHRMNSRVPVRLEWETSTREHFRVEAHTRVVNPYGCMVVIEQSVELEQRLELTNLANDGSNAAIVVWKGSPRPGGWEYGIELVAPEMNFWGLDL